MGRRIESPWGLVGLVAGALGFALGCGGKALNHGESDSSRGGTSDEPPPMHIADTGAPPGEPPPPKPPPPRPPPPRPPPPKPPPPAEDAAPAPVVIRDASALDARIPDASALDASTHDTTAPVFGGALTAIVDSTEFDLTWTPANDDVSAAQHITYRVYVATRPGAPTQSTMPTLLTDSGVLGAKITGVSSRTTYYVVVHAVDEAGNEDTNDVELVVKTLTSFTNDVQPIFTASCALPTCHTPGNPPQGLILKEGYAYSSTVDKVAGEGGAVGRPDIKRVDSSSSDPNDSYLWWTIQDPLPAIMKSAPMPPASANRPFNDGQRQIIGDWIREGARQN